MSDPSLRPYVEKIAALRAANNDLRAKLAEAVKERDAAREIFVGATRTIDYERWIACVNERDALRADLAALRAKEEARVAVWQPIETAPKDGSPILAGYYRPDDDPAPGFTWWGWVVRWRSYHPNAKGAEVWRDAHGHKHPDIRWWVPIAVRAVPTGEGG